MKLPTLQYGTSAEVKRQMRAIVKRIIGGESLIAAMTAKGLLDVADTDGQLLIGGVSRSKGTHFHTWAPWHPIADALTKQDDADEAVAEAVFTESLTVAWGVLGMLQHNNQWWVVPPRRHRPFLEAAVKFWDELDGVGEHYCFDEEPQRLWAQAGGLHYVLAQLGVTRARLRESLPSDGLRALLKYVREEN